MTKFAELGTFLKKKLQEKRDYRLPVIVNMDLNEEINFDKNSSTLEQFFAKNRLSDYLNQFIESGYVDMSFILDMNEARTKQRYVIC